MATPTNTNNVVFYENTPEAQETLRSFKRRITPLGQTEIAALQRVGYRSLGLSPEISSWAAVAEAYLPSSGQGGIAKVYVAVREDRRHLVKQWLLDQKIWAGLAAEMRIQPSNIHVFDCGEYITTIINVREGRICRLEVHPVNTHSSSRLALQGYYGLEKVIAPALSRIGVTVDKTSDIYLDVLVEGAATGNNSHIFLSNDHYCLDSIFACSQNGYASIISSAAASIEALALFLINSPLVEIEDLGFTRAEGGSVIESPEYVAQLEDSWGGELLEQIHSSILRSAGLRSALEAKRSSSTYKEYQDSVLKTFNLLTPIMLMRKAALAKSAAAEKITSSLSVAGISLGEGELELVMNGLHEKDPFYYPQEVMRHNAEGVVKYLKKMGVLGKASPTSEANTSSTEAPEEEKSGDFSIGEPTQAA